MKAISLPRLSFVSLARVVLAPYERTRDDREFVLERFGRELKAAVGTKLGVDLLVDYDPANRDKFLALAAALKPNHHVNLVHNTDPKSDPFAKPTSINATQRLGYGLGLGKEIGSTSSDGPLQAWLHQIGMAAPTGADLSTAIGTAADSIADALLHLGPDTSIKTFGIEPLNRRENAWLVPGENAVELVRQVRRRVGRKGPQATLLVDTSHTAEETRTKGDLLKWLRPAAEEGLVGTLHVSTPVTRGNIIDPTAPWGELGVEEQLNLWVELGLFEDPDRSLAVEIFDPADEFLRTALALPQTFPPGEIVPTFAAGYAKVRQVLHRAVRSVMPT